MSFIVSLRSIDAIRMFLTVNSQLIIPVSKVETLILDISVCNFTLITIENLIKDL